MLSDNFNSMVIITSIETTTYSFSKQKDINSQILKPQQEQAGIF